MTSKRTVRIRHVIAGILPYVKITKVNRGCKFCEQCKIRRTEVDNQPSTKPKKSGGKGSVPFMMNSKQLGCVFQDMEAAEIQVDFTEEHKILGTKAQRAFLKRYASPLPNLGKKKRVPRKESFRSVNLTSVVLMLQNPRIDHMKKPCNKNDAPAEKHGIEMSTTSKERTKPHRTHLQKFGHYQRHLRRNQKNDNLLKIPKLQCTC